MYLFSFGQTLDQSNAPSDVGGGGFTISSTGNVGQSFTAGLTGNLSQVNVRLGGFGSSTAGDFQIRIFDGEGYGGTLLNTTVFTVSTFPVSDYVEIVVPLSSAPSVVSGNKYTIDLRGVTGVSQTQGTGGAVGPYTAGLFFANQNPFAAYSLWFKTFVNVPTPATHLNFDGSNDFVNIGNPIASSSSYTKEAMIFTNNITGSNILSSSTSAFWFWQGNLQAGHGGGFIDVFANASSLINSWNHVALTYDSATTTMKLYINGVLVSQNNSVGQYSAANIQIGAFNSGSVFNGNMDEVRIWNVARTTEQIRGSMNCELQGTETGLIAYYKFNQGVNQANNSAVTTLNATVGSNGTLTNFALTGTTSNWLAGSPVTTGSIVPSVAAVTTPVVYNQGDTASALTATTGANGTGLLWYTTATAGVGSATAPTPSTSSVGSTSYWVSSTNANGCESNRVEIVVNVVVVNDECPNAINLTVGSSSFSDFPENVLLTTATNSGSPAPTCGNFQGGDVWYTATVPASGNIVIETDGTGIYDTGLEVYSGACGALNLVSCDDNSGNGDYSKIVLLGQTPGTVLRIRVWENVFGISNAQFQVSAYDYVNPATHLSFDGTNDFVVSANAITNNTQNQTYQAWFRIPSVPTNSDRILQRGSDGSGGWSVQIDVTSTGRLSAGISASPDTFLTGTTVLNPNTWYQATFVFENNNSLRLYLDGNLEASVSIGNRVLRNSDNRLRIGTGNIASEFFRGDIDEVRIWNIALTATDIINTMNCETQQQPELVAHYKLNQGFDAVSNASETTAADSSGNGNNGTLTNFALTGVTSNWASGSVITTGNTCATLSSSDFENSAAITIYPNPSNGIFNIVSQENISIEVYDLIGKLIMSQKLSVGTNSFDISNFNTGVYLLKVINGNGKTQTHKLIKN
mgnify:CR=1 FL=1